METIEPPVHTSVEKTVLKRITPAKKLPMIVQQTLKRVELAIKQHQLFATITFGGSSAKGTYLKNDHDIDVFVRFSADYDDDALSEHLEYLLKSVFKTVERVHGSRDYFHVQVASFTFEFIPVRNVSSWAEAKNVTDMSPLHVDYVVGKIKERPWLANEIRLTKQFCKAAKMYGAESYIGGFSGHVVDLLIISYGGFRKLLEAAASWPAKVVLDPEQCLTNPLTQLNNAKIYAPLVIVDPVQQDRNSAAAVTKKSFDTFRSTAKAYLRMYEKQKRADRVLPKKSTVEEFFTIKTVNIGAWKKEHNTSLNVVITIVPLQGKKDVIGAKCMKVYEHCVQQLLKRHFTIIASMWEFTTKQATILFAFPKDQLPAQEDIVGPPSHMTSEVAHFQSIHKMTFSKDGRIRAVEKRAFTDPKEFLKFLLREEYVTTRVKKAVCK